MRIEYVLIEKAVKSRIEADKTRVKEIFADCFLSVTGSTITIAGKRKNFELSYCINCGTTTSSENKDYVYNISIVCNHSEKAKCAELLEQAHLQFRCKIDGMSDYHLIVAEDGLSEYYCNKAYPKYQKFERELRHLIFKIVTKAYGNLWTAQTLSPEMKKKLKENIKARSNGQKDDVLIEAALHEMTMGQLIDYLFYGAADISIQDYLDEHLPPEKLRNTSKEELIQLLESGRRKSVWNMYFANQFMIDKPREKLATLRSNRNKVAHCKQFHSTDYQETVSYLDMFMTPMETAIKNATFKDPVSVRDVLCNFGEFTIQLMTVNQQIGKIISPALQNITEISEAILKTYNQSLYTKISESLFTMAKSVVEVYQPIDSSKIPIPSAIIDSETVDCDYSKSNYEELEEDKNANP